MFMNYISLILIIILFYRILLIQRNIVSMSWRRDAEKRERRVKKNPKHEISRNLENLEACDRTSSKSRLRICMDSNVKINTGKFSFRNGDIYEGGYKLDIDRRTVVKQDRGVYTTNNSDVYDGTWNDDKFTGSEFHILYNNNAQYKGYVDEDGTMHGPGTYVFPDESLLAAVWSRNRPVTRVVYKEPLGRKWMLESISDNRASFITGNHFWDEMCAATSEKDLHLPSFQ